MLNPSQLRRLVAEAKPAPYWTDRPDAPDAAAPLVGEHSADLVIIGGGFTGLWAALQAIEENPGRRVAVVEAETVGFGASTRNGGFCEASLTHGLENGVRHWPDDIGTLNRMGDDNLAELIATLQRLDIDAAVEATGQLHLATEPWQVDDLREGHELATAHGISSQLLDESQTRSEIDSPTYLGGQFEPDGAVLVNPALLVWGLREAAERLGVHFFENSRVRSVDADGNRLRVTTANGSIRSDRVIVATNAWAEPEPTIRNYVIPIYDHVLMTEPLSASQLEAIGWKNRQGLADAGYQFHYYRLTADNRILWGGYDANYHAGNGMGPDYELRTSSHELIAGHFFETFPQLEGLGFSHRWAGPIGTTSKFAATFGTRHDNRLAWAAGYTGLGVGASRWGARVALDLVDSHSTERTDLRLVRRKPVPFPPEPLRYPLIQYTRRAITAADANRGREGLWLRLLDTIGVGFDS